MRFLVILPRHSITCVLTSAGSSSDIVLANEKLREIDESRIDLASPASYALSSTVLSLYLKSRSQRARIQAEQ